MSGLRSSVAIAAAALFLVLGAGAARAQDPLPLLPGPAGPEAAEQAEEAETVPLIEQRRSERGVTVDRLDEVDPDSFGLIGPDEGGFAPTLWRGAPRWLVELLLPRLPTAAASPAMHDLMRRLLLSGAAAPQGEGDADLLGLRLRLLFALGEIEAVERLLEAAPRSAPILSADRLRVDRLFLTGELEQVCRGLQTLLSRHNDPYWQQTLIVCQAAAGDRSAAELGLELLREQGAEPVPGFARLVQAVLQDTALPLNEIRLTPHTVGLMLSAVGQVPASLVPTGSPPVWRALAANDALSLETRIAAAEMATRTGLMTAGALSRLYLSVEATPEEAEAALQGESEARGPIARALRYQAARSRTDQEARAEALQKSWRMAMPELDFVTAAQASAIAVLSITPNAALADFAPDAVVVLLASGRPEAASAWFGLLREQAVEEPAAAAAIARLAPMMTIAGAGSVVAWDDGAAIDWYRALPEAEAEAEDGGGIDRARRMFGVLEALGHPIGREGWALLLEGLPAVPAEVPPAALLHRLDGAAAEARAGEAIVLALLALGEAGAVEAGPHALVEAVGSLRAIGLERDARNIALEAVLAPVDPPAEPTNE